MQISMSIKFSIFLLCLKIFLSPIIVHSECNVCQQNGAACKNLTTFNLCFGGFKPYTDQEFVCDKGLECTDLPTICFQSSERPASCGAISSCDRCNKDQVFACTSRTTFSFCFGSMTTSDGAGKCPPGLICDASTNDICVKSLHPGSIVCDRDAPLFKEEEEEVQVLTGKFKRF